MSHFVRAARKAGGHVLINLDNVSTIYEATEECRVTHTNREFTSLDAKEFDILSSLINRSQAPKPYMGNKKIGE